MKTGGEVLARMERVGACIRAGLLSESELEELAELLFKLDCWPLEELEENPPTPEEPRGKPPRSRRRNND